MGMQKAARLVEIKAGPQDGLSEGQFTAYASVFDVIDSYGDKVVKGAFTDTLAEWAASDGVLPLLFGHNMSDPDFNVGFALEAKEDDHGLYVHCQLDLDGPKAAQVYRLIKGRRLSQMSFAYDVLEGAWVDTEDDSFYELRKLKLYEVSLVPIGANQETELLAVKSAGEHAKRFASAVKSGRVLSSKNETTLRDAHTQLSAAAEQLAEVLSTVEQDNDQEKNAQPAQPAPDATPAEVKSSEPTAPGPADYLTVIAIREKGLRS